MGIVISGCGFYLPEHIITNAELAQSLGNTTEEWIETRTGITQRQISPKEELPSQMALAACNGAIADSKAPKEAIDLIIVCTSTPDSNFPSIASKLQGYLGLNDIPAFDINAACAGFVYGLHVAQMMMQSGEYSNVLLVGMDKMSSIVDWNDRSTSVLFGDGAGAVILTRDPDAERGIIDSMIFAQGEFRDILYTDKTIKMNGREVFRHATEKMSDVAQKLLAKSKIPIQKIDHFVPHQANVRIINAVAKNLGIDESKVVKTVSRHANCSAASIPLALYELKKSGKLCSGDVVWIAAIGAGLVWGGAIMRW